MKKRKRRIKLKLDEDAFELALQREFDIAGGKVIESVLIARLARSTFGLPKSDKESRTLIRRQLAKLHKISLIKKILTTVGALYWAPIAPGEETVVLINSRDSVKASESAPTWPEVSKIEIARKHIARLEISLRNLFVNIVALDPAFIQYLPDQTRSQLSLLYGKTHGNIPEIPTPDQVFSVAGIYDFFHILRDRDWQSRYRLSMPELLTNPVQTISKLKELAEYRNRIQHNESLTQIEIIHFIASAWLTIQDINDWNIKIPRTNIFEGRV